MKYFLVFVILTVTFSSCEKNTTPPPLFEKSQKNLLAVSRSEISPYIDGKPTDPAWKKIAWISLDNTWLGDNINYAAQYKLTWTPDALYILLAIEKEQPQRTFNNPLTTFKDQNRVIIYLDENNSGGDHAANHSAFAYQVLSDGFIIDYNAENKPTIYNNHIDSELSKTDSKLYWEIKVTVFKESYCDNQPNEAVKLSVDKKLGFALAYISVDSLETTKTTNTIIGSVPIPENYKNRIASDSGLFGTILLSN